MNEFDKLVKAYADEKLTLEKFEELEENELVENMENCGNSGRFNGYTWYNVKLTNGDEFSVYIK